MGDADFGQEPGGTEEPEDMMAYLGACPAKVNMVEDAAEETLLLWAFLDPVLAKQNAIVSQVSLQLKLDACGQLLHIISWWSAWDAAEHTRRNWGSHVRQCRGACQAVGACC